MHMEKMKRKKEMVQARISMKNKRAHWSPNFVTKKKSFPYAPPGRHRAARRGVQRAAGEARAAAAAAGRLQAGMQLPRLPRASPHGTAPVTTTGAEGDEKAVRSPPSWSPSRRVALLSDFDVLTEFAEI